MSDETVRLSTIAQLLRRRWAVLLACAALGAGAGAGVSVLVSPGYEAATSVLLQGKNADDALASAPRLATSTAVLDRVTHGLPWHPDADRLRDTVSAEAGDGNVVTITADAANPGRARQLADRVAKEYIEFSDQLATAATGASTRTEKQQRAEVRNRIAATDRTLGNLLDAVRDGTVGNLTTISTRIEKLRGSLDKAASDLEQLDAPDEPTSIVVIGSARTPSGQAPPTMPQCIAAGAALFVLLAIFVHLLAARTDRRLQRGTDIAAALGTRLLGSVDVVDSAGGRAHTRRGGRLRALLHGDPPWTLAVRTVAADDRQPVHYRQVLSRVAASGLGGTPVLVVLAEDDAAAHRAFDDLATAAATRDGAREAGTDGHREADGAARNGSSGLPHTRLAVRTAPPAGVGQVVLHRADIRGDRPIVPDSTGFGGAVAIVTAGTRTSWELVTIAEACVDAGRELGGVVVTQHARRARVRGGATQGRSS